ncbi:MAG: hypothetical protein J6A95_06885 [Clostridia bacterium]|nr:hypothetical protein [Clostridia bacterium]
MKKKDFIASLISLLIVYGVINLILFLVIPEGRTDFASFWIAWSFTFPLPLLTAIGVTIYCALTEQTSIVKIPLMFTLQYSFAVVYLVAGIILMLINKNIPVVAWVVEAIITAIFVILLLYAWLSASYISKNIKHTKKKVFYIRSLQADIDTCIPQVDDGAIQDMLRELSSKIRFSDPMSHASLKDIEQALQALVGEIVANVSDGKLDLVPELVKKATVSLDSRNNKCKLLK